MLTKTEAEARVSKGAAHLDVVRPGWFDQIDVGHLAMACGGRCIIGQLAPAHLRYFAESAKALGLSDLTASACGFDLTREEWHGQSTEQFALLQDAWIIAIAARRHPVSEPVVDGESTVVCLDLEPSHVAV